MTAPTLLADRGLSLRRLLPGLTACLTVAMAARFLSEHYGGPAMLFALLLGMAFHFLFAETTCQSGIEFGAKRILRIGVALLGLRITFADIGQLGLPALLTVIAGTVLTIGFGVGLARLLRRDTAFGLLSGGAVAICGASAAMAIAAVLPRNAKTERATLFTVIGVTALSTLAMILYPLIVGALNLSPSEQGLFLGGTIHDVAQVVGAGYGISVETGDAATITKMLRVALLVPVVFTISLCFRGQQEGESAKGLPLPLPLFLVCFIALVSVKSAGLVPPALSEVLVETSRWCLITAIAALGMKTSFGELKTLGPMPVLLLVLETLFLAGFSLSFVML